MSTKSITERLSALQDSEYKNFIAKLTPTVDKNNIIGVRTPEIRKLAKEIYTQKSTEEFLNTLPHRYFEENLLHAFLIEREKDAEKATILTERFLPFIDNWAVCDQLSPKAFKKIPPTIKCIEKWLKSNMLYTVRFGIVCCMRYYLDSLFKPEYLKLISSVKSEEYYINMAVAWFFATALAKQYEATLPILENGDLSLFVHNQTIKKAIESLRITKEHKAYLKSLG